MEYIYGDRRSRYFENAGLLLLISGQVVESFNSISDDMFLDEVSSSAGVRLCAVTDMILYNISNQYVFSMSAIDKDSHEKLSIRYYISAIDATTLDDLMSKYNKHSRIIAKYIIDNILKDYAPTVLNESTLRLNIEKNILKRKRRK